MEKKKVTIGIPRGLFYYRYFPFWRTFFEELGTKVIVSPPTNKEILAKGLERLTSEVCLPVKAFCGQTISLKDKCDFVLIPSIFSLEKNVHHCPKFIGLPDLIKAVVPETPPILDPEINFDKGKNNFYLTLYNLGSRFTSNPLKIKRAIEKATKFQEESEKQKKPEKEKGKTQATIALIAHPYLIYDEHLNHRLVSHLEKMGVNVLFPEIISKKEMRAFLDQVTDRPYWTCEDEIIGVGIYFLEKKEVDGLIFITAFGCGPDSTMFTFLENYAKKPKKPFLEIVFDEHIAETGLITRIEAFIDTILDNKKRKLSSPFPKKISPEPKNKIKILGVPYLGGRVKVFRELFKKNFNISMVTPPVTSKTFEIGVKHSPESVCFPFKVVLGTFIECLEKGADTLIMTTSFGPCRIGYYRRLLEEILTDLGYNFELFKIRSEDKGPFGVLKTIKRFSNNTSWPKIVFVFQMGIAKLRALDKIEREVQKIRAREIEKGKADQIFEEAIKAIDEAPNLGDLKEVLKEYLDKLRKIPQEKSIKPLKIGLIGEIYVLIEPFVNTNIEKELGKMRVEVERVKTTYLSEYTNFLHFDVLGEEKRKLRKFTQRYLKRDVGGHALESVGKKITWAEDYDGLIHLMPFGCLPEVIAQNIMTKTEEKIPVLTVACDEKLAKAGLVTRLEAFVDLLWDQRKRNHLIV